MTAGPDTLRKLDTAAEDAAILFDRVRLPQAMASLLDPLTPGLQAQPVAVGGRGAAWFVHTDAGPAVLRHYRRGGLAARVSQERYLWVSAERSRGFHEFRLLRRLRELDLPVPAPLVAGYWRSGRTYRAALLVERIVGARSLGELLDSGLPPAWAAIGGAIARFHRAGAFHADLNVDNVLMDPHGTIWLIDFDRGALRKPARRWQQGNLERLQRSLRKRLGVVAGHAPISDGWRTLLSAYHAGMASASTEPRA
jgi:3-deoxy-D-manno-octulosonic acid kinase